MLLFLTFYSLLRWLSCDKIKKMKLFNRKLRRQNASLKKKITEIAGEGMVQISPGISPELENQFLQNVLAFEPQYKKGKRIKVSEKIGNTGDFGPVDEIPVNQIEQEWLRLYNYMYEKGIDLQVCSPNVGARELYRFATEELFKMKIDNISVPGMMTCFIYDEFYPDHCYDNEHMVVDYCIKSFFSKQELMQFQFNPVLTVNNFEKLSWIEFQGLIHGYYLGFEKTKNLEIKVSESIVEKNYGRVSGSYKALFIKDRQSEEKHGNWIVELGFSKKMESWVINNIQIEGIDFGI